MSRQRDKEERELNKAGGGGYQKPEWHISCKEFSCGKMVHREAPTLAIVV